MDGGVSPEGVRVSSPGGVDCEILIDIDHVDLGPQTVEQPKSTVVLSVVEASHAPGLRQCCSGLDVHQPAAHDVVSVIPEPTTRGARRFSDEQRHERRRVEIADHRRWSSITCLDGIGSWSLASSGRLDPAFGPQPLEPRLLLDGHDSRDGSTVVGHCHRSAATDRGKLLAEGINSRIPISTTASYGHN